MLSSFPLKHFKAKKKMGQNFLAQTAAANLVNRFSLSSNQPILEIGPGFGSITQYLVPKTHSLTLIEKDPQLVQWLENKYSAFNNITIISDDILAFDFDHLLEAKMTVVSNLPYNLATAILQKLCFSASRFKQLFLTFPRPVAHRILAFGNKNSYLAIFCKLFCDQIKEIAFLKRELFSPVPKVDSIVLQFCLRSKPLLSVSDQTAFLTFIKLAFHQPRKILINNLIVQFERKHLIEALQKQNLKHNIRAEVLTFRQFLSLYDVLKK